ncbi:hypothetical protein ACFE04_018393 [Oxalis oulophora]
MAGIDGGDSIFSRRQRLPEDTVLYGIFPDSNETSSLESLHLQILSAISPLTSSYIWQLDSFTLSISSSQSSCPCISTTTNKNNLPHLHGKLRYGDNLDDEWFTVFLLFHISQLFPTLSIRVWDSDGEFLLIEAAYHLPRWLGPENSDNRVFIRKGDIHIIPKQKLPNPNLTDSLNLLIHSDENGNETLASDEVQRAVKSKIKDYPERARRNTHTVRVRLPVAVAQVLKCEPCLISLAVEGFYDRDIDTMKFAAKMDRFLSKGREEELVCVNIKMSRAMYAQLTQQSFQAPKCYPMPSRAGNFAVFKEAELGMKIVCGFEMMYQQRKKEGGEGKGSTWSKYKESLEKNGYFQGSIPGSSLYKKLMENAEEYYRKSSTFTRTSEMMSAPVRCIDEILALPHSADDFKGQEVSPSDDDSWLYGAEDELNSALEERQKEMDLYYSKFQPNQKSKEAQDNGPSSSTTNFDLGDVAKNMQAFVEKLSSFEGAEVPQNRDLNGVEFDVDRFMKDVESVMKGQGHEETDGDDFEEGSSSDMDFDESDDGSDIGDPSEEKEDAFVSSYSDVMNKQLKKTTLEKSFVRANEEIPNKDQPETSKNVEDMDEDFTPVDVDVNLVKNFLESFSSQQGLPGPASNLLGLMGLQLPKDTSKDK